MMASDITFFKRFSQYVGLIFANNYCLRNFIMSNVLKL